MSDDTERGGRRCGHVRSASMTLCTSSFASPICSSTIVMSIVGRPGMPGALAVHAVLSHHRERVGQQVHRHGQPAAIAAHHGLVLLELVVMFIEDRLFH